MPDPPAASPPIDASPLPEPEPDPRPAAARDGEVVAAAGEIGHELNNLMTVVLASMDQLRQRAASDTRDAVREARLVARAGAAADRAVALAKRLLALARDPG